MATQIPVKTKSGAVFYVEADAEPGHPNGAASGAAQDEAGFENLDPQLRPKGTRQGFAAAGKVLDETAFEKAVSVIRGLVEDVSAGLMSAQPRPDQVELEFSLGMGASGSVMIFKGEANASFKLKLTWKMPTQ